MWKYFRFFGPGMMVAVGYMDPGNWATDIAGGARYEYQLLFVILLTNIFAMFLQHASIRLGIATGFDLAESCRLYLPSWVNYILWILCEIAIVAMDLAEVLGSAIALKLLFGIPLLWGVLFSALDVFLILFLFDKKMKWVEIIVSTIVFFILGCFVVELFLSKPQWAKVFHGFIPTTSLFTNISIREIAIGILGATVMPHNLYLHSYLVKNQPADISIQDRIRWSTMDSTMSLMLAFLVNASIVVLAASTFYLHGMTHVSELEDAYAILNPILGVGFASTLFALALLASGQNATITGTLAGQVVMEGFLHLKIKPWLRRVITRSLAIFPTWFILYYWGESSTTNLIISSQIVLSLQLGFAIVPLVYFTSKSSIMGNYCSPRWLNIILWGISFVIIGVNLSLLWRN